MRVSPKIFGALLLSLASTGALADFSSWFNETQFGLASGSSSAFAEAQAEIVVPPVLNREEQTGSSSAEAKVDVTGSTALNAAFASAFSYGSSLGGSGYSDQREPYAQSFYAAARAQTFEVSTPDFITVNGRLTGRLTPGGSVSMTGELYTSRIYPPHQTPATRIDYSNASGSSFARCSLNYGSSPCSWTPATPSVLGETDSTFSFGLYAFPVKPVQFRMWLTGQTYVAGAFDAYSGFGSTLTIDSIRVSPGTILTGAGLVEVSPGIYSIAALGPVNPIPEPETYALMLAGLGLLGAVTRRRRT